MNYKSEIQELQDQIDFLKKVIILPLAIALIFSLTFYLIKFF